MDTPATAKAVAATLKTAELSAERERSPVLAAAYDAATAAGVAATAANTALAQEKASLIAAAKALINVLEAQGATIAGCATQIATLKALCPAET